MSSLHEQGRTEIEAAGFSRRRFLGASGVAAMAMAAGSVGLEPLVNKAGLAEAAQEVGPLLGPGRINTAYQHRIDQANRMANVGSPVHLNNGDEDNLQNFIGNYSKALPHNAIGEVDPIAYGRLMTALLTGTQADFDNIALGGRRRLTNPQAGLAFDMEGNDPHQFVQPPAPSLSSAEAAGEMVELYWMALLRDISFLRYDSEPLAAAAVNELNHLSDFRGPKQGGRVTLETLFRDSLPGTTVGPYMSQFWYSTTPFGSEVIDRRSRILVAGSDHMTSFEEWLAVQNGSLPGSQRFDTKRRYLSNGRDSEPGCTSMSSSRPTSRPVSSWRRTSTRKASACHSTPATPTLDRSPKRASVPGRPLLQDDPGRGLDPRAQSRLVPEVVRSQAPASRGVRRPCSYQQDRPEELPDPSRGLEIRGARPHRAQTWQLSAAHDFPRRIAHAPCLRRRPCDGSRGLHHGLEGAVRRKLRHPKPGGPQSFRCQQATL